MWGAQGWAVWAVRGRAGGPWAIVPAAGGETGMPMGAFGVWAGAVVRYGRANRCAARVMAGRVTDSRFRFFTAIDCGRALSGAVRMASEDSDVAELMAAAEAAAAAAEALANPSVEQEAAAMAEVQARAEEFGVHPKSHGEHGWAGSIMRKFERFIEKHGPRLEYDAASGPTLAMVEEFVNYCTTGAGRVNMSSVGRVGMCDKYFQLQLPSALAQKVFPMMKLAGWTGLRPGELKAKALYIM